MNGMILKVLNSLTEDGGIIPETSDPGIAGAAEDPSDFAGFVTVVDAGAPLRYLYGIATADFAEVISVLQQPFILLGGNPVCALAVVLLLSLGIPLCASANGPVALSMICAIALPALIGVLIRGAPVERELSDHLYLAAFSALLLLFLSVRPRRISLPSLSVNDHKARPAIRGSPMLSGLAFIEPTQVLLFSALGTCFPHRLSISSFV